MFLRKTMQDVEDALARQAAVALLGPRQVGKTTLALVLRQKHDAVYLDLETEEDRTRLTNAALFLASVEDRLVILDEIHRAPELFSVLRGVIDQGRREGKGRGRFLILGSASLDLLKQSESLAGRIAYVEMTPLQPFEVEDSLSAREALWLRGGFPDAYLAASDQESLRLRKDFIRTYLERDIPAFGLRVPATTLLRLWTMLAHGQGGLLNASSLARALGVSVQSVTRYLDLLCDLLLVRRLPPFHANVKKRLVKSPKVIIRDSGLVHALLGVETLHALLAHPVVGQSWEGFVIEAILASLPWGTQASFYRTAAGAEMDLVLEYASGRRVAIEIKRGVQKPGRGFYQALDDLAPQQAFVVHADKARAPLQPNVEMLGLSDLLAELRGDVPTFPAARNMED